jgi:hypothetical protein
MARFGYTTFATLKPCAAESSPDPGSRSTRPTPKNCSPTSSPIVGGSVSPIGPAPEPQQASPGGQATSSEGESLNGEDRAPAGATGQRSYRLTIPSNADLSTLSPRSMAILRRIAYPLALGYTLTEIGNTLGTSRSWVAAQLRELAAEIEAGQDEAKPSPRLGDGLYRVETKYFVAGFVVENGYVVLCAPILKRHLSYWITKAERIGR